VWECFGVRNAFSLYGGIPKERESIGNIVLRREILDFRIPRRHKNLGMVTMACVSKRAFRNRIACEIMRRAKVIVVLQNTV
jgi:hypothetical protein